MSVFHENRALLDAFRRGESDALAIVYRRYARQVETVMRRGAFIGRGARLGGASRMEVADLVQEAFSRAFSKDARLGYDGLKDYQPYLMGISRNVLSEWARKRGRELPSEDVALETPAEEVDPEDAEHVRLAQRYVQELSGELKQVYEQRYAQARSQNETAQALGMSRQSVRTLEQRLRQGLKRWLQKAALRARTSPERTRE